MFFPLIVKWLAFLCFLCLSAFNMKINLDFQEWEDLIKGPCQNKLINKQVRIVWKRTGEWVAEWFGLDDFLAKCQNFLDCYPGSPERHCLLWGK